MPGYMVFRRDMILNTPFIADWGAISLRKQKKVDKNNKLENKNRKRHTYGIRYKVLVRNKKKNRYDYPHLGPYPITQVWKNGNSNIRQGVVQERIIIIWIKPYRE